MYRRLLRFLRPHAWRMVGTIACNVVAAALDVFSFTLLIPFLNALFKADQYIPGGSTTWIARLQQRLVGSFLDTADPLGSVESMIIAILAVTALKNLFVWLV
jgi:ABC-type multidrug transport system fused ATPase/permease subunit